eukprot:gene20586-22617_t
MASSNISTWHHEVKIDSCSEIEYNKDATQTSASEARDMLRREFSSENIKLMAEKRAAMEAQTWHSAVCSFNGINNKRGTCGGVYEIKENNDTIYISGLPQNVHIRDALNAHFSGHDGLALGAYLTNEALYFWSRIHVRFMPSKHPWDDAKLLLRYHQLKNKGRVPKFN